MGLSLSIGILASTSDDAAEVSEFAEAQISAVNTALHQAGLPAYKEPFPLDAAAVWAGDMFGYSGLHYLRRLAAHLDAGKPLPSPGDDEASKDPVLQAYYQAASEEPPTFLGRLRGTKRRFARGYDHLILHSDAEGYYLPFDFQDVIFPPSATVAGDMIGSAVRLAAECQRLADVLAIPPDLDADAEELWDAADDPGAGPARWQTYGVESFTCVRLLRACRAAMASHAALVFC